MDDPGAYAACYGGARNIVLHTTKARNFAISTSYLFTLCNNLFTGCAPGSSL